MIGRAAFSVKTTLAAGLFLLKKVGIVLIVFILATEVARYFKYGFNLDGLVKAFYALLAVCLVFSGLFFFIHLLGLTSFPPGATRDDTIKDMMAKMDSALK